MVAPLVAAAGIGAVSSLLGGFFSSRSARRQNARNLRAQQASDAANRASTEKFAQASLDAQIAEARRSEQTQKEFAQMGIRWRMEDAKAAGLHPLSVLGASGASYSPSTVVGASGGGGSGVQGSFADEGGLGRGLSDMGQNLSQAIALQETPAQAQLRQSQLKVLESEASKNFAEASYYASEAARNGQAPATTFPEGTKSGDALQFGDVTYSAPEVMSRSLQSPETVMGTNAFWQKYNVAPGVYLDLPAAPNGGVSEALEAIEVNPAMWAAVVARNMRNANPRLAGKDSISNLLTGLISRYGRGKGYYKKPHSNTGRYGPLERR